MRRIPVILGMMLIAYFGTAQSSFGLSLNGIYSLENGSTIMLDNGSTYDYEFITKGSSSGYSFGLNHMTSIGDLFYFHKELLYTKDTKSFYIDDLSDKIGDSDATVTTNQIQLPVAAGMNIKNFMIGAGPVFTYNASTSQTENLSQVFRIANNKLNYGVQVQFGYNITNKLTFLAKYMKSYSSDIDGFYYNDQPVKSNTRQKQISFGLNYNL